MIYLKLLVKTELVALAALAFAGAALAAFSAVQASLATSSALGASGSAEVVFVSTLFIGSSPVILFGAPLYSALRHFNKMSWLVALGLGAVPGIVLMFFGVQLGLFAFGCGLFVAAVTHVVCGLGSNNSFKPNPLRSSKHSCTCSGGSA
jgi:hypothetical protein